VHEAFGLSRAGATEIRADADVYLGRLAAGTRLAAGDGASIVDTEELTIEAADGAEFLHFDLPAAAPRRHST